MARDTRLSWMTTPLMGNRQGILPTRTVGVGSLFGVQKTTNNNLRSEKRVAGTDSGRVICRRASSGNYSWFPLLFFFSYLLLTSFQVEAKTQQVNTTQSATQEELMAAQSIEALLLDQMIQQMRKTVPESEVMPKSQSEKIYEQILDSEYAQLISRTSTIGIAELVLAQIKGNR